MALPTLGGGGGSWLGLGVPLLGLGAGVAAAWDRGGAGPLGGFGQGEEAGSWLGLPVLLSALLGWGEGARRLGRTCMWGREERKKNKREVWPKSEGEKVFHFLFGSK